LRSWLRAADLETSREVGLEIELSQILGRKVDMRTAEDLSRYFRDEVVDSALVQYESR
jgi:predicted nucleotidyltransferase